jgi:ubiquinone biosynthesis protein Coq4
MKTAELVKKCQDRMKSIRDKIETKRKPKQETFEEEAELFAKKRNELDPVYSMGLYYGYMEGAERQSEKMYSEQEVIQLLTERSKHFGTDLSPFDKLLLKQDLEWFEKFKK